MKPVKRNQQLRLQIQPQPPKYPFVNHPFEVNLYLVDEKDHLKNGSEEIPLQLKLCYDDAQLTEVKSSSRQLLVIVGSPNPCIGKNGMLTVKVMITDVSMNLENRRVCLRISTSVGHIEPIRSEGMYVIKHRLVIREQPTSFDGTENQLNVWYKDEGGKDKVIELKVYLFNAENNHVHDRQVPLLVTLLYEDGHEVGRQDILKMSPDSRHQIDESGTADIKVRIDEVSKNHQGQSFKIRVAPHTRRDPQTADISPDTSGPISVRSKRNKLKRNRPDKREVIEPGPPPSRIRLGGYDYPPSYDPAAAASMPNQAQYQPMGPAPRSDKPFVLPADGGATADDVRTIINWSAAVVHDLQSIQWTHLGYETKADGSPDHSKPLYSIPNPNAMVLRLLHMYTDVMISLQRLAHVVDAAASDKEEDENPSASRIVKGVQQIPQGEEHPRSAMEIMQRQNSLGLIDMQMQRSGGMDMARQHSLSIDMHRQNSLGVIEVQRQSSLDWSTLDYLDHNIWQQQSITDGTVEDGSSDMTVQFILARRFITAEENDVGLPAFDKDRRLVGFYQERETGGRTTVLFVPLERIRYKTPDRDIERATNWFLEEYRTNSSSVFSLVRCNGNLEKMKEDAIIFALNESTV